ncbi:MAG: alkaline phosphatase family protein [Candidatus Woesearchaeota archaeon]
MLPDYKGRSIVNLMSSIGKAFGAKTRYKELKLLRPAEIKKHKNIVLMVIDGLGYDYFKKRKSGLKKGLRGMMTSVIPPTTASAVTTFTTGDAPQQHAYTGWFMHLKELGIVSTILPFAPRIGGLSFDRQKIKISDICGGKLFFGKIKAQSFMIMPKNILACRFNRQNWAGIRTLGYPSIEGFLKSTEKAVKAGKKTKYIYAYWPEFDSICHHYGVSSKVAEQHFNIISKKIEKFIQRIKGTNTLLIITADHGLIDTPVSRITWVDDHPRLKECLTLPLCGEARFAYCYVHPSKAKQFEWYVRTRLKKQCRLHKSQDLIRKNWFGLFEPDPRLFDRIGDYVVEMKENNTIIDQMPGESKEVFLGHHGGTSRQEMLVPLIVFSL